jgi:hypothetical protein
MKSRELKVLTHGSNETLSIGCVGCPDLEDCGGLYSPGAILNCLDWCLCIDPTKCDKVCPRNELEFVQRVQEIKGFTLRNLPRAPQFRSVTFPSFVPMIYHGSRRETNLKVNAVAIPMQALFKGSELKPKYSSREEIFNDFKIAPQAKLLISAVDLDSKIEPFWSYRHTSALIKQLATIKPDLFTCPNYSLLFGVPRHDNLYSLKRVLIGWNELVQAGINTSLHLNARTDRDWHRLTEFVGERDEVTSISFEFGTGAKRINRGEWHSRKLLQLAESTNRDLQLIVRGGNRYLSSLRLAFREMVSIDTTSFMKTVSRQKLTWYPLFKPTWLKMEMPVTAPLDSLLQENIEIYQRMMSFKTAPKQSFRAKSASASLALR